MSAVLEQRTTNLADLRQPQAPEARLPSVRAGFNDLQGFELAQRAAKALAASTLVPQQFQGNLPNCLIALEMAQRIGASPLMVMQNLYIVHGRPGWSAKFLIASFNQCGRFSALRFEWAGERGKDSWGCRAWAVEKETGERIEGPLITIALAKAEGWEGKSGSKWKTIPELMLTYRAAAWLVNTHAPEISMGLNTADEIGDTFDAMPAGDGSFTVTQDDLRGTVDRGTGEINGGPDVAAPAAAAEKSAPAEPAKTTTLFEDCMNMIASAQNNPDTKVALLKLDDVEALLNELEDKNRKKVKQALEEVRGEINGRGK